MLGTCISSRMPYHVCVSSTEGVAMPRTTYTCRVCGTVVSHGKDLCKKCWGETRRGIKRVVHSCFDCGKELSHASQATRKPDGRCWDCHVRHLASKPFRVCTLPDCERPHEAKGLCNVHYKQSIARTRGGPGYGSKLHRWVSAQPCQLCGYNQLPSEVNRIVPENGYRSGNVNALCSRCHREVTSKITIPPEPLTVPWL